MFLVNKVGSRDLHVKFDIRNNSLKPYFAWMLFEWEIHWLRFYSNHLFASRNHICIHGENVKLMWEYVDILC